MPRAGRARARRRPRRPRLRAGRRRGRVVHARGSRSPGPAGLRGGHPRPVALLRWRRGAGRAGARARSTRCWPSWDGRAVGLGRGGRRALRRRPGRRSRRTGPVRPTAERRVQVVPAGARPVPGPVAGGGARPGRAGRRPGADRRPRPAGPAHARGGGRVAGRDLVARFGLDGAGGPSAGPGPRRAPTRRPHPRPGAAGRGRARPAGRAGRHRRLRGQGAGRRAARPARPRGLACTRVAIVAETEHGESLERLWRHEGALTAGGDRRPGALAARRVAHRVGRAPADQRHHPAGRWCPTRSWPPRPPARVLGRRDGGRRAGGAGPGPGAGAARPRRRHRARVAGRAGSGRAGGAGAGARGRPRAAPAGGAARLGRAALARSAARRPRRRPCTPSRCRSRWSTPRASRSRVSGRGLVSAAPARLGRRRAGRVGRRWTRWWRGPGRGRPTSAGGIRPPIAAGPASRWSPPTAGAHLLAVEGGRWWVEATYD